jgi:hypothetical protein
VTLILVSQCRTLEATDRSCTGAAQTTATRSPSQCSYVLSGRHAILRLVLGRTIAGRHTSSLIVSSGTVRVTPVLASAAAGMYLCCPQTPFRHDGRGDHHQCTSAAAGTRCVWCGGVQVLVSSSAACHVLHMMVLMPVKVGGEGEGGGRRLVGSPSPAAGRWWGWGHGDGHPGGHTNDGVHVCGRFG